MGDTGAKGSTGAKGTTGPKGLGGDAGDKGTKGETGPKGGTGIKGDPGEDVLIIYYDGLNDDLFKPPVLSDLTLSGTQAASGSIADSGLFSVTNRGLDVVMSCDVILPATISGTNNHVIFEKGGSGIGAIIGVIYEDNVHKFYARAGDGASSTTATNNDTVITKKPISEISFFDGNSHTVTWQFEINPGRLWVWIDDYPVFFQETLNSSSLDSSLWAGSGGGNYLTGTASDVGGLSFVTWPNTTGASSLSVYNNQLGAQTLSRNTKPAPPRMDGGSTAISSGFRITDQDGFNTDWYTEAAVLTDWYFVASAVVAGFTEAPSNEWTVSGYLQGEKGETGVKGEPGVKGAKGGPGATGAKGATGDTGDKGAKGGTGAEGVKGATGDPGSKGSKGGTGAGGPKGTAGDPGAKGSKGGTGAGGPKGTAGDPGAKGSKG